MSSLIAATTPMPCSSSSGLPEPSLASPLDQPAPRPSIRRSPHLATAQPGRAVARNFLANVALASNISGLPLPRPAISGESRYIQMNITTLELSSVSKIPSKPAMVAMTATAKEESHGHIDSSQRFAHPADGCLSRTDQAADRRQVGRRRLRQDLRDAQPGDRRAARLRGRRRRRGHRPRRRRRAPRLQRPVEPA